MPKVVFPLQSYYYGRMPRKVIVLIAATLLETRETENDVGWPHQLSCAMCMDPELLLHHHEDAL